MLGGGISYTVGVIFYAFGKKAKYIHSIWHLFVFLGTVLQFIAILKYIIMGKKADIPLFYFVISFKISTINCIC